MIVRTHIESKDVIIKYPPTTRPSVKWILHVAIIVIVEQGDQSVAALPRPEHNLVSQSVSQPGNNTSQPANQPTTNPAVSTTTAREYYDREERKGGNVNLRKI